MTQSAPLSNAEQIVQQIADLQQQLQAQAPGYTTLLRTIHGNLKQDPDMVHLLSDEQIGVIVAGLSKHKGIVVATATAKGGNGKKSKSIDVGDL